jgi:hypothetical protein
VEKFEQPLIGIHLLQGRYRGVIEGGVGLGNHLLQVGFGNCVAGEFRNHVISHILIGAPAQAAQLVGGNLRP